MISIDIYAKKWGSVLVYVVIRVVLKPIFLLPELLPDMISTDLLIQRHTLDVGEKLDKT